MSWNMRLNMLLDILNSGVLDQRDSCVAIIRVREVLVRSDRAAVRAYRVRRARGLFHPRLRFCRGGKSLDIASDDEVARMRVHIR